VQLVVEIEGHPDKRECGQVLVDSTDRYTAVFGSIDVSPCRRNCF